MTVNHAKCVLAIVGSRDVPDYQSESLVKQAILEHDPKMIVSGGAKGVDQMAVRVAEELGIAAMEFVPEHVSWDAAPTMKNPIEQIVDYGMRVVVPGGFKIRNEKIAEACECLVRIASQTTKTYGSGWTADRAEQLGKRVYRHTA